jgi:hypothetical protein
MLIESTSNADGYIPNSSLFGPWVDSPTQVKKENSHFIFVLSEKFTKNFQNFTVVKINKKYLGMFINFTGL